MEISASANSGWRFGSWSDGVTNNPYSITVPATNITYTATFLQPIQIDVPGTYSTIQAAINAAHAGDVINIAAGRYNEGLTINKAVTLIGSGTNNCVVYYTNTPTVVSITGPGTVRLANFEIVGGQYVPLGINSYYSGTSSQGIVATNVTLVMDQMVLNQFRFCFVTVVDGSLYATNVALYTRAILQQCDLGFQLKGCLARIYQLTQQAGQIPDCRL